MNTDIHTINAIIHDQEQEKKTNPLEEQVEPDSAHEKTSDEKKDIFIIPENVRKKFVEINNRYYYPEQTEIPAFVDHGNKLHTDLTNDKMTKTLIDIVQARKWKKIQVQGNKAFKRDAWLQASSLGINVTGYEPTKLDLAELKRRINQPSPSKSNEDKSPETRTPTDKNVTINSNLTRGTIIEHGEQHYNYDQNQTKSYVVKIKDEQGNIKTKWGVELGNEIKDKKIEPGDKVDLILHGKEEVTVKVPIKDKNGKVTDYTKINTHRNRWEIQTERTKSLAKAFEESKSDPIELAKKTPELKNAAATVAVAQKFANEKIENTDEKERFLSAVSTSIKKDIEAGNSIKTVISQEQIITKETELER